MKVLEESLILALSFIIIFIWSIINPTQLTAPFLGLLITIYLIASLKKKRKKILTLNSENPLGIFILNILIFILIFSFGSLNSPIFFLIYFLAFGIAFIFEPITIFVFILGSIFVFLPDAFKTDVINNVLKLVSLSLIAPLAYFFGKEYKRNQTDEEKLESLRERSQDAADTISEDIEKVIKDEKANLRQEDVEKLNEVLEETEDLRAENKNEL